MELNDIEKGKFLVTVQAIVFDQKTKKILIGKREKDPYIKKLTWCFIGGRAEYDELENPITNIVKENTGLDVEVKEVVHAKTYPEERKIIAIYYKVIKKGGELKKSDKFVELKWIKPTEVSDYFTTSLHDKVLAFLKKLEE